MFLNVTTPGKPLLVIGQVLYQVADVNACQYFKRFKQLKIGDNFFSLAE